MGDVDILLGKGDSPLLRMGLEGLLLSSPHAQRCPIPAAPMGDCSLWGRKGQTLTITQFSNFFPDPSSLHMGWQKKRKSLICGFFFC